MSLAFLCFVEMLLDPLVGLLWSLGPTKSEPIADSVDMCIDADVGEIIEMREDDFGGFDPDSWELHHLRERTWDETLMFFSEYRCTLEDIGTLVVIKIDP